MVSNILLLNGSTRINGNSLNICNAIKEILSKEGKDTEIISIQRAFNNNEFNSLENAIRSSDIIGIVSPLYVDTFPYPVLAFLEAMENKYIDDLSEKGFFVIGQCNFPESRRIDPLIRSGKCFCNKVNMRWLGGLSYGGAIRIESKALDKAGKEGERISRALESAMKEITSGNTISDKSKRLFKNDVNKILYRPFIWGANIMFRRMKNK
ncbi:NAD(P)H-dependent oxidoreductase [Clostridium paraputrificum]|uniref:NAD(P)H-dependent oxidoreductase n=1 Tax=Clostridium TaxID=1485 RepID=UPI003D33C084